MIWHPKFVLQLSSEEVYGEKLGGGRDEVGLCRWLLEVGDGYKWVRCIFVFL